MNLILLDQSEINANHRVLLQDRRGAHILKVLRCGVGDTVKIGLLNGPQGHGRISACNHDQVELEIFFDTDDPVPPLTDLILALPRPIMLQRVLSQAAAMGVKKIFIANANRVEKSFFHASLLQKERYQAFLLQGLEQAVATFIPEVSIHKRFKPFVQDYLPMIINDYQTRLIAHPTATATIIKHAWLPLQRRVIIAIGPEGGWVDFEIARFQHLGFQSFSLGNRILRVDTAVPAILAQIELLRTLSSTTSASPT